MKVMIVEQKIKSDENRLNKGNETFHSFHFAFFGTEMER